MAMNLYSTVLPRSVEPLYPVSKVNTAFARLFKGYLYTLLAIRFSPPCCCSKPDNFYKNTNILMPSFLSKRASLPILAVLGTVALSTSAAFWLIHWHSQSKGHFHDEGSARPFSLAKALPAIPGLQRLIPLRSIDEGDFSLSAASFARAGPDTSLGEHLVTAQPESADDEPDASAEDVTGAAPTSKPGKPATSSAVPSVLPETAALSEAANAAQIGQAQVQYYRDAVAMDSQAYAQAQRELAAHNYEIQKAQQLLSSLQEEISRSNAPSQATGTARELMDKVAGLRERVTKQAARVKSDEVAVWQAQVNLSQALAARHQGGSAPFFDGMPDAAQRQALEQAKQELQRTQSSLSAATSVLSQARERLALDHAGKNPSVPERAQRRQAVLDAERLQEQAASAYRTAQANLTLARNNMSEGDSFREGEGRGRIRQLKAEWDAVCALLASDQLILHQDQEELNVGLKQLPDTLALEQSAMDQRESTQRTLESELKLRDEAQRQVLSLREQWRTDDLARQPFELQLSHLLERYRLAERADTNAELRAQALLTNARKMP